MGCLVLLRVVGVHRVRRVRRPAACICPYAYAPTCSIYTCPYAAYTHAYAPSPPTCSIYTRCTACPYARAHAHMPMPTCHMPTSHVHMPTSHMHMPICTCPCPHPICTSHMHMPMPTCPCPHPICTCPRAHMHTCTCPRLHEEGAAHTYTYTHTCTYTYTCTCTCPRLHEEGAACRAQESFRGGVRLIGSEA